MLMDNFVLVLFTYFKISFYDYIKNYLTQYRHNILFTNVAKFTLSK